MYANFLNKNYIMRNCAQKCDERQFKHLINSVQPINFIRQDMFSVLLSKSFNNDKEASIHGKSRVGIRDGWV